MAGMFGDPRTAPGDAPLAVGADFRPSTLIEAYSKGIFPWPDGDQGVYWWSPDPRAVFPVGTVKRSRSLTQRIRNGGFSITTDQAFHSVIEACADRPGEGTWITPSMRKAYEVLHREGHAHSVEVWREGRLVGGLYGITVGAVFTGESMFHLERDTSKVALVALDDHLLERGFHLIDAQLHTDHLQRMGAIMIPRSDYLDALARLRTTRVSF
ncbi:MAG: leucyl/phenylalanyl-tRNA--protein transferase [Euzebya sp.]